MLFHLASNFLEPRAEFILRMRSSTILDLELRSGDVHTLLEKGRAECIGVGVIVRVGGQCALCVKFATQFPLSRGRVMQKVRGRGPLTPRFRRLCMKNVPECKTIISSVTVKYFRTLYLATMFHTIAQKLACTCHTFRLILHRVA